MSAPTGPVMSDPLGRLSRVPRGCRSTWVVLGVWIIALLALGTFAGNLSGAAEAERAPEVGPGK